MSTSTLPSSRSFVTQLLNSLPSLPRDEAESNLLIDAPESVKKQLLSLQVLFPNEFLPALDLLDRRLVTRFRVGVEESNTTISNNANTTADVQMQGADKPLSEIAAPETEESTAMFQETRNNTDTIYYVRSAQQRSSRFGTSYDSTTSYEVRLRAWNCTCPAFAFAAFPSAHPEPDVPIYIPPSNLTVEDAADAEKANAWEWVFGGVSLGDGPPVCKHLLACVLGERCSGIFGDHVEERRVSVETAAGWAAGWGDL